MSLRCGGRRAAACAFLVLVAVGAGLVSAADEASPPFEQGPAGTPSGSDEDTRFQQFASKLSPHEPLYFAVGWRDVVNARFQISFRYRFLDPAGGVARRLRLLRHLHLGYTQTSVWDLESASAPFFDTSYRPSLFINRERVRTFSEGAWLGLQSGFEHESNGKGGEASRSLNIIYVTPVLVFGEIGGGRLRIAPKLYAYLGDLSDNPDIADYRGWVDLRVDWMRADGIGLATTLRKGGASSYGSVEVDLSYPLDRILGGNLEAYLHLQYFNGWGETLRTYDQKLPAQLRLGLMVVR